MFFQHYTIDDFRNHEKILNKKINVPDLEILLQSIDPHLHVVMNTDESDVVRYYIETSKPGHMLIHGKSLNKLDRARKYNSFKNWLTDGFPIVVDINALRKAYPGLDMMSDLQMALFTYAALWPLEKINSVFGFEAGPDHIMHFIDGYKEWGVSEEFDRPLVAVSKLIYLTKQGRKEQGQW